MGEDFKLTNVHIFLLFGFVFFSLGTLGLIQIGILDGVLELVLPSFITLVIGIVLLIMVLILKKLKKDS